MVDRGWEIAVPLVPAARSPVKLRKVIGLLVQQPGAHHVREEVMVAIPAALVVQWHDEEIALLQRFQEPPAVVPLGDGVAQRAAQPVEDGGTQQEIADICRLASQDLLSQVVPT